MKKKILVAAVLSAVMLTGCSESAGSFNEKGMEYHKQNKYEKAISAFEEAVKKEEDNPVYLSNLGKAYKDSSDNENAIKYIELAIKNKAENTEELYYMLADCYFRLEMYDEGIKQVENYVNCSRNSYENYLSGYELLSAYELYMTAESLLEQAKNLKLISAKDYNHRGLVYYYLGEYDEALKKFELARESGYKDAVLNVAKVHTIFESYDMAISAYEYYETNVRKTSFVCNQKGNIYMLKGEYEKALAAIEEGISLLKEGDENRKTLMYNQVIAYEKVINYEKALELIEKYIAEYPEDMIAKQEYEFLKTR